MGLHHPLWVTDPALDFREHVYRVGCPAPGTDREFAQLVSDFASRPLDRTRPLWESWVVDGLQSGNIAIITKIHHALADGVATAHLVQQVHSSEPVPFDALPDIKQYPAPPIPSPGKRMALALVDVVACVPKAALMLFKRRAEVRRLLAQRGEGPEPVRGFEVKTTAALNSPGESHRQLAILSLPLSEMKSVGAAFGATINDVFLAVCAGGVRRFLLERGQLPDFPLVGGVPVSTRDPNEQIEHGNKVSLIQIRLATILEDLSNGCSRSRPTPDWPRTTSERHSAPAPRTHSRSCHRPCTSSWSTRCTRPSARATPSPATSACPTSPAPANSCTWQSRR